MITLTINSVKHYDTLNFETIADAKKALLFLVELYNGLGDIVNEAFIIVENKKVYCVKNGVKLTKWSK